MTMSTNLGWPSEPDPEPEHRRLGWLARMLGVSRETGTETDAGTHDLDGSGGDSSNHGAADDGATPVSSQPSASHAVAGAILTDPSVVVEDSVVAALHPPSEPDAENTLDAGGSSDDSDRHEVEGPSDLADRNVVQDVETHKDVETETIGSDETTESDESSQSGESHDTTHIATDETETAEIAETDETAVRRTEPDPADTASGVADMSPGTAEGSGGRPASTSPASSEPTGDGEAVGDRTGVPTSGTTSEPPVDNAVDELDGIGGSERENPQSGAGDNLVDEPPAPVRELADHDDREALVAALPTPGTDTPLARELAENARRRIQLTGRPFPKPVAPRVLTVANQKGGVGKTTTTVNVAAALAQAGLTVLVIDLDPQGNASTALGIDHHAEVPSIYDVLVDGTPLLEVVQPCSTVENLHCAPATIDLAGAEIELVSLVARESRLHKAIAAAAEQGHAYDYILIDCPPSLGLLTVNAMVAASEVFIPIQCEYYALEGLSQLLKNIDLVKRHLNPALHVSTILLTMYDGRTRLSAQVADEVREHFPEQVLRTTVPRSVRVSEAPSFGETVMTYDPASSGALAYLEAAGELADRGAAGPA